MHDCPKCGMACDCDGEDTWLNAPDNCACDHEGSGCEDDDDIGYDEDLEDDDLDEDDFFPDNETDD